MTKADYKKAWRERSKEHLAAYEKARAQNPERVAARKKWREANRAHLNARKREWVRQNREKRRAQMVLYKAIRAGKIKRQLKCEIAGCGKAAEAHHPDYTKPLDVRWLCRPHHYIANNERKKETWIDTH